MTFAPSFSRITVCHNVLTRFGHSSLSKHQFLNVLKVPVDLIHKERPAIHACTIKEKVGDCGAR
jgi:hypothetical protein